MAYINLYSRLGSILYAALIFPKTEFTLALSLLAAIHARGLPAPLAG